MTFAPGKADDFLRVFEANKLLIAGFEGCLHLELHRDAAAPDTFFTISRWHSEDDLENYRRSELFQRTWAQTKVLFGDKPKAWTLQGIFESGSFSSQNFK
ncbi:MAG: hypothetical protein FD123_900 [Bacteroidetes bacterium]|nr:MAG: hypothetical protein FD123_900 [Bacteroidota bacterium]